MFKETKIPKLLCTWITQLLNSLPVRIRATFLELLVGAILSCSGHITDAFLAIQAMRHFSTYYWLITKAKWSWIVMARALAGLIVKYFPRLEWNFVIDDFITARASKKAPGTSFHYDHSKKPNRPKFIWGQCWVALGLSISWGRKIASIPLLFRLQRKGGNHSKIQSALTLIQVILPIFQFAKTVRCFIDAWYMKAPFVLPMIERGVHIIGQVRKDTALYLFPKVPSQSKRGRPRKYGQRITQEVMQFLPIKRATMHVWSERHEVLFRSIRCKARFLKGREVVAVWMKLQNQKDWSLILSTDLSLSPERIIRLYSRRWRVESMFNELKHLWGIAQAWQQHRQSLCRWVTVLNIAYTLPRLMALINNKEVNSLLPLVPWRKVQPVTAGLVRMGLKRILGFSQIRILWNRKAQKVFTPEQRFTAKILKAA